MEDIDFSPNRTCERCSNAFYSSSFLTLGNYFLCMDCTFEGLFDKLSIDLKEEIDQLIYDRSIINSIKTAKDNLPISLHQAVDVIRWRHRELLKTVPNKFNCTYEEYWKNLMT